MAYLTKLETGELIVLMRTHSEEAFSVLYDSYSAALFGVICKMVDDHETARDLLQDAFIKIWKGLDKYDAARSSLFTWMMNITRNTCIDHFRSRERKKQMQLTISGLDCVEALPATEQRTHDEGIKVVQQLTQNLRQKYKEVINLIYIYGYTQEEVSGLLSIPLGTVKTRCYMAVRQLRDLNLVP